MIKEQLLLKWLFKHLFSLHILQTIVTTIDPLTPSEQVDTINWNKYWPWKHSKCLQLLIAVSYAIYDLMPHLCTKLSHNYYHSCVCFDCVKLSGWSKAHGTHFVGGHEYIIMMIMWRNYIAGCVMNYPKRQKLITIYSDMYNILCGKMKITLSHLKGIIDNNIYGKG